MTTPRLWLVLALVELMFAAIFLTGLHGLDGIAARLSWSLVFALVPTLLILSFVLALSYFTHRRRFRQRLREGTVLEVSIGDSSLTLSGPWSESTLSFEGLKSVRSRGGWVFLQQIGSPLLGVWPLELFPPAELARMVEAVQSRTS